MLSTTKGWPRSTANCWLTSLATDPSLADATLGALPATIDGMNARGQYMNERGAQTGADEFRYRDDVTEIQIDDGRLHALGVISQQIQTISPEWVSESGTWLQPDAADLLLVGLHAIQQLARRVEALQERIALLEPETRGDSGDANS